MKRAFASFLLLVGLSACDRYPSGLSDSEQVQALVLMDMAAHLFDRASAGDDSLLLFLSYGKPPSDVSQAVQTYVSRSFRSARLFTDAIDSKQDDSLTERGTGRRGILLSIESFSIPAADPLTIKVSHRYEGMNAAGYAYRLSRANGRWTILDRKQLWIA